MSGACVSTRNNNFGTSAPSCDSYVSLEDLASAQGLDTLL